uniref:F-box/SPRY domain-containing protein 1 n=1 Tax=Acrobeloides nanus TaxID=290746 RepID=A0A914CH92_9BILA
MRPRRAVSATRLPHEILKRVFSYLYLRDLAACMRVCRHWFSVLEHYCSPVWEYHTRREVPDSALSDPYMFGELTSFKEKLRAFHFAWNPKDSSRNNFLRTNGKIGVSTGVHAWEIVWEGPLGTVAVIGVATKHAAMQCHGYIPLLGSDDQSWGWNLVDNQVIHNGTMRPYPGTNNPPKYQPLSYAYYNLTLLVELYFEKGSEFLGVAFTQIPPVKLYPAMCAVYGNTEITLIYMGPTIVG